MLTASNDIKVGDLDGVKSLENINNLEYYRNRDSLDVRASVDSSEASNTSKFDGAGTIM